MPIVIEERLAAAASEYPYLADEQRVVAAFVRRSLRADDVRDRTGKHRNPFDIDVGGGQTRDGAASMAPRAKPIIE